MWNDISISDYGYTTQLVLCQDGVAEDISSYTTRKFIFTKPDGTDVEKTATFATNGTDGALTYAVVQSDIIVAGNWEVRAQISKVGAVLTSRRHKFVVRE